MDESLPDFKLAHELVVGLGGCVAVLEGAFLPGLAPEDLVVAVRVEGRVDVDEVDRGVGEFLELHQVVAAIDDAGIHQGRRFTM